MKRVFIAVGIVALLILFVYNCAGFVYVSKAPPPAKSEIKPPPPHKTAVWIDGHWGWNGHKYIWVKGHWEKKPKGQWVKGHWKKRGGGHAWVAGHWKR